MKSTKNTGTKPAKNTQTSGSTSGTGKGKSSDCCGSSKRNSKNSSQEEEGDPLGSYTGNPTGWGKYADPVQDADDL